MRRNFSLHHFRRHASDTVPGRLRRFAKVSGLGSTCPVGPVGVLDFYELIQVGLDLLHAGVEVLPESDLIELLLDGLVEPLHGAVGLRMPDLDKSMLDLVEVEE